MPTFKSRLASITSRPYWWAYAIGIVLLIVSTWLWWTRVYLSPSNVFWGMMNNSLHTNGVTVETRQQSQQGTMKQDVQFELGKTQKAHSVSTIVQGTTTVQTEVIGTSGADYARYRSIKTNQKNAQGQPLDIKKVLGIWSKSEAQGETAAQNRSQLFAQALIGVGVPVGSVPVPLGNLTQDQRDKLLTQIKEQGVYNASFKDVVKHRKNGRLVYTYHTKIQTILYVQMMKDFGKYLGFTQLEEVDPNSYQSATALQVDLTVDAKTRQLVGVLNSETGAAQEYRAYGLPLEVSIPKDKDTISSAELQKRLSQL